MVDLQELVNALQGTIHPDNGIRKAAEEALAEAGATPGFLAGLLQLSVMDEAPAEVRQMAAIQFKNTVHRSWSLPLHNEDTANRIVIPDSDKQVVRENIVEAIIRSPHLVRVQVVEALRDIVYEDFPQQWPHLLDLLSAHISSGDKARVHGALFAVRMVSRRYEFKSSDERQHLEQVVSTLFPGLLSLLRQLVAGPWDHVDQADMMKLILKAFWSATYLHVPAVLASEEAFLPWVEAALAILRRPVPEGQPEDAEARARWTWWKLKKWAMHFLGRALSRLCTPEDLTVESDQCVAKVFRSQCLLPVTETYLQMAAGVVQGQYLSPRTINLMLAGLSDALAYKESYLVMKPHMEALMIQLAFPLMCFNDDDKELWEEDPAEYIRKGYDAIEELYSEKNAAISFMIEVAEKRPGTKQAKKKGRAKSAGDNQDNLGTFLGFLARILNEYTAAGHSASVELARRMDGALQAVGALAQALKQSSAYKGSIEPMLVHHVVPCFKSPHGFLRAKACWVAHMYAEMRFSAGRGKGSTFEALFHGVMMCLGDQELPVRVDSCLALSELVECMYDIATLKPILPELLRAIFALMAEVEHEDLVVTLETIVERMGDEIAPYAVELAKHLTASLGKVLSAPESAKEEEDDDATGILAAYGCMRAMSTVIEAVSSRPQLLPPIEEVFYPVLGSMLGGSFGDDLLEETLDVLTYLTYYSPEISPRMWEFWPVVLRLLQRSSIEYFERVLAVLDNFIGRGTTTFLSNPDYLVSVFQVCSWVLTNPDFIPGAGDERDFEDDLKNAPKLMEVVLMNCRGQVDTQVGLYLRLVSERLSSSARSTAFQDALVMVVFQALIYDAGLALRELAGMGALEQALHKLLGMVRERKPKKSTHPMHFRSEYQKKVVSLGLTALINLGDDQLPPVVAQALPAVMDALLETLGFLKDDMERARLEEEEGYDEEDSGSEEMDEEAVDDEEDFDGTEVKDVDLAKIKYLLKHKDSDADSDGDFSDVEWFDDDDDLVVCPLDDRDAFIDFTDSLRTMQQAMPGRFQALTGRTELQEALREATMYADKRRAEIAAEAAKKASEKAPS